MKPIIKQGNRTVIECRPYILSLNQITSIASDTPSPKLNQIAENFKELKTNSVLPIACMTDNLNKYQLLTGQPIYQAAKIASLKEIWVFIIAAKKEETNDWIKQSQILSELNKPVITLNEFIKFINDKKSDLTSIKGIGQKTAQKIISNGPYQTMEDLQKICGPKRPLTWSQNFQV